MGITHSGIPDCLKDDFKEVFKLMRVDSTQENMEKAANVAETNYKLRSKKKTGKQMKVDETNSVFPLLDKALTDAQIMEQLLELCSSDNFFAKYTKVRVTSWAGWADKDKHPMVCLTSTTSHKRHVRCICDPSLVYLMLTLCVAFRK